MSAQLCRTSRFRETVPPLLMVVLMSSACDGLGVSTSVPEDPNVRVMTLERMPDGSHVPQSVSSNADDVSLPRITRIVDGNGKVLEEKTFTEDELRREALARRALRVQAGEAAPAQDVLDRFKQMRLEDPEAWDKLMSSLPENLAKGIRRDVEGAEK